MPIFEYSCHACGRRFSALVGVVAGATPAACPRCGGTDLKKLVSRFARLRSEDEAVDALADRADRADLDDPREMRRLMKEMAGEMGEDMEGEDFEQMMEEAMEEEATGSSSEASDPAGGEE
jgi:putative FmdB family regulatory protein